MRSGVVTWNQVKEGLDELVTSNPYVNYAEATGDLSIGQLLRYLDICGGMKAIELVEGQDASAVTLAVSTENFTGRLLRGEYSFKPKISRIWNKSLEVSVGVYRNKSAVGCAYLTFVPVKNGKSVQVRNSETLDETLAGEADIRKAEYKQGLQASEATEDETRIIQNLHSRQGCDGYILVSEATKNHSRLIPGADTNIHKTVFGGYIMELLYECAVLHAHEFSGAKQLPLLARINQILFKKPVEPNSVASIDTQIMYTSERSMVVKAYINTSSIPDGNTVETNTGVFTFAPSEGDGKVVVPVGQVVAPQTAEEVKYWCHFHRQRLVYKETK